MILKSQNNPLYVLVFSVFCVSILLKTTLHLPIQPLVHL
jgi:hypothetical protein